MNKNSESYKNTYSSLRPSDEAVKRVMNMTNEKKRVIKIKPLLATAACLILIVAGVFAGSAVSAKISAVNPDNLFTITAYANGKEVSLKDTPLVETDVRLEYQLVDGKLPAVTEAAQGFQIDGKNIKSITYSAEHGEFSYTADNDNVKVVSERISQGPQKPYACELKFEIENDEGLTVDYIPSEAIDVLLHSGKNSVNFAELVNDTITVTVEYKDGSTANASIITSFDENGKMQLEYQE